MEMKFCQSCGMPLSPEVLGTNAGEDALPGTPFRDLPDDWVCPECGAEKEDFEDIDD